ncbi:hypothetical protein K438DRAFT_1771997 [Mycena galopus ATCC 62051]|nr:hypothetical protein K438DRAFT_1771997 [Mycena galopus ATCC 62051]
MFLHIEKPGRIGPIVQSSSGGRFAADILVINRTIQRLERSLKGGCLAVWFSFEETQQELAEIQRTLAPYETSIWNDEKKMKFRNRVQEAQTKDATHMREKIGDLVKKIDSAGLPRRNLFLKKVPRPILRLDGLFPALKNPPRNVSNDEAYRLVAFQSFLNQFRQTSPADPPILLTLMQKLKAYVTAQIARLEVLPSRIPLQIQVIKKPSGSIVTVLLGSESLTTIRRHYYCDPQLEVRERIREDKLPILYTATTTVGQTQGQSLWAQQAIHDRPDSRKYVEWREGANPLTELYLVENPTGGDPFILATLLGATKESDVVKALPRDDRLVKHVICPTDEHPWIADDGWIAWGMDTLQCNDPELHKYNHQIFVRGPHPPV